MADRFLKPRSDFERKIAVEAPAFFSLARRLVDDTLLREERMLFERTQRILELQSQDMKMAHIAEELGVKVSALTSFVGRGRFRVMSQFIRERETNTDGKVQDARAKNERARFEALGPRALDFLERCFEKDGKGGFKSKADARWATAMIAKGKGWDEKEDGHRRLGEIKIGVIMAQQHAIRASDERCHGSVIVEAAGKRVELPLTPARDAEALDGEDVDEKDEFGFPEIPTPVPDE